MGKAAVGPNMNSISDQTINELASLKGGAGLKQRVGLRFSCNNLPNLDVGSKTDPFVVLWDISKGRGIKPRLGTTEVVADSLNPEFITEIFTDYFFEQA